MCPKTTTVEESLASEPETSSSIRVWRNSLCTLGWRQHTHSSCTYEKVILLANARVAVLDSYKFVSLPNDTLSRS